MKPNDDSSSIFNNKKSKLTILGLILLVTVLTFFNSLNNGFVSWDDKQYIYDNPLITSLSFENIKLIFTTFNFGNYQPLVILSYSGIYSIFKLNPFPYHAFSLVIHLFNIILVFNLILLLLNLNNITNNTKNKIKITISSDFKFQAAAIATSLFAVHPMFCENICWASDFKDLIFTFFYLSSILVYLKYIKLNPKPSFLNFHFIILLVLFLCSLLSKSTAVTLPVILILIDYYSGRKINFKSLSEKATLIIFSLIFGILNIISQYQANTINITGNYNLISNGIFISSYNLLYYLFAFIFPSNLSAIHPFPDISNNILPTIYYISPLILITFIITIIWLIKQIKPLSKNLIFGFAFFLLTISLTIQIIPIGITVVSERYTYLPFIGLFFLTAGIYQHICSEKLKPVYSRLLILAFIMIILIFIVKSNNRSKVWHDNISLYTDVINKYPGSSLAYDNRGYEMLTQKDFDGAISDFNMSIKINPKAALPYLNRGIAFSKNKDSSAAIKDFIQVIKIKPNYSEAYYNKGNVYLLSGNYNKAIIDYSEAIRLKSDYMDAYFNRAVAKFELKDRIGSCSDLEIAAKLGANDAQDLINKYCK